MNSKAKELVMNAFRNKNEEGRSVTVDCYGYVFPSDTKFIYIDRISASDYKDENSFLEAVEFSRKTIMGV